MTQPAGKAIALAQNCEELSRMTEGCYEFKVCDYFKV